MLVCGSTTGTCSGAVGNCPPAYVSRGSGSECGMVTWNTLVAKLALRRASPRHARKLQPTPHVARPIVGKLDRIRSPAVASFEYRVVGSCRARAPRRPIIRVGFGKVWQG